VIGIFGAVVTGLLTAFPKELVVAIAGLALLGTIGAAWPALRDERHREAALITFLVTLSGVTLMALALPSGAWSRQPGFICATVRNHALPRMTGVIVDAARVHAPVFHGTTSCASATIHTPCKFCSSPIRWNPSRSTRTPPSP
jgi:hypothetical protein